MDAKLKSAAQSGDKIKRYGWELIDGPGTLMMLPKDQLLVDHTYQRDDAQERKELRIASAWSWMACGALSVAKRGASYYVMDGQGRLNAAKRRSDITLLPCVVFEVKATREEALAFLRINGDGTPVSALQKYAEHIVALSVQELTQDLGITVRRWPRQAGEIRAITTLLRKAEKDIDKLRLVLSTTKSLCDRADSDKGIPIPERLVEALWYLNGNVEGLTSSLLDRRFVLRLYEIGAEELNREAVKAASQYARGGAKVWGIGILNAVNKGLRNRFRLKAVLDVDAGA